MIDPATLNKLRGALSNPDECVRAESVDALWVMRDVPGLVQALGSPDRYLRMRAAPALAKLERRICRRMARLIRDPDPDVRAALAEACGAARGWRSLWVLACLGADESAQVRYRVLLALAARGGVFARRMFRGFAARETELWVREAASVCLVRAAPSLGITQTRITGP